MAKETHEVKERCVAKDNPDKAERLAQALRDNLKRRKAQARERNAEPVSPPEAPSRD